MSNLNRARRAGPVLLLVLCFALSPCLGQSLSTGQVMSVRVVSVSSSSLVAAVSYVASAPVDPNLRIRLMVLPMPTGNPLSAPSEPVLAGQNTAQLRLTARPGAQSFSINRLDACIVRIRRPESEVVSCASTSLEQTFSAPARVVPAVAEFKAEPLSITRGGTVQLSWRATDANTVQVGVADARSPVAVSDLPIRGVTASGSATVQPEGSRTYRLVLTAVEPQGTRVYVVKDIPVEVRSAGQCVATGRISGPLTVKASSDHAGDGNATVTARKMRLTWTENGRKATRETPILPTGTYRFTGLEAGVDYTISIDFFVHKSTFQCMPGGVHPFDIVRLKPTPAG